MPYLGEFRFTDLRHTILGGGAFLFFHRLKTGCFRAAPLYGRKSGDFAGALRLLDLGPGVFSRFHFAGFKPVVFRIYSVLRTWNMGYCARSQFTDFAQIVSREVSVFRAENGALFGILSFYIHNWRL